MGRGKIEIKRIENSSNRQVTYSKRRNGIMKKAKEITILCDAKVSLIIFGSSGKMHEYCSPSTNLVDILDQYQKTSGKKLWDAKHENLSNEIDRIKKENDNMQIELRHLKGEDITSLPYKELMAIEDALENGLTYVRGKQDIKAYQSLFSFSFVQMDVLDKTWKNTKFLEEDYKQLSFILVFILLQSIFSYSNFHIQINSHCRRCTSRKLLMQGLIMKLQVIYIVIIPRATNEVSIEYR
ncbi:hypothetical protein PVK06_004196 [Gossypium arboreum]|uniref:Floral homeotic protein PMADS 2-like n=1 Tax=Gossypium arboreum TaxID=29729 RepID=A0ABR0QRB3_GOSAR|nr:hypothetical protein PVK06_004196 [Gossypium arboreum]